MIETELIKIIDFTGQKYQGAEQCRRLFHGRGGAYAGLEHVTIDWLPPVALITLYKEKSIEQLLPLAQSFRGDGRWCEAGC